MRFMSAAARQTNLLERRTLDGLPGEALYSFLERSSGAARVPPEVAAHIVRRSDGNPLLAAEMLRHLETVGAVVRNGERLEARSGWDSDAVPQQLHDLVAARVAGLDEDDRALLEAAAADGREFDGRALAAVSDVPLIQVLRRLQGLCRSKTLIIPSEAGYRFATPLLQQVLYEEMAPESLRLPSGRSLPIHYEPDRPPWVASRLQDFFGMKHGPRLGSVPLVLHLLAPNQRPVQVTTDLEGFWQRHYPELRTQLMRRYPRHAFPEDPLRAEPPTPRPAGPRARRK
jgi:hypothetical protein